MFDFDALLSEFRNEFRVCDRCKGVNLGTLLPKLEKLDENARILKPTCQSYCGPGRDYPFVFLNNKPVKAETEVALIEKLQTLI